MDSPSLVLLMIDGLRARSVGAYGNTWYPTPALDQFASESLLFDRYLTESTDLGAIYRSLWTGRHAMLPDADLRATTLLEHLSNLGYLCHLVTDEPEIEQLPLVKSFDQKTTIDTAASNFASDSADTCFGKMFAAIAEIAGEWSSEYEQPRCLWAHLRGFYAPWNAPPETAAELLDDDDPELTPSVTVPRQIISNLGESADEVFHANCRYAGQVMALDQCFGALRSVLAELFPEEPPILALAGLRGFPLGEHGAIGNADASLPYGEQFHVPLLIHLANGHHAMQRHRPLAQSSELYDLILAVAEGRDSIPATRTTACGATASGDVFIQNDEWHFVRRATGEGACELYVKPDDLWEANDVASRCPEIVEEFSELASNPAQSRER